VRNNPTIFQTIVGLTLGLTFIFSLKASASLTLPTNLNFSERDRITEILGLGNSTKLTTNPYPLGGYSGVEVSYGMERINTEDISQMGDTSSTQKDLSYSRLSVGKGIYNNIDIFVHFIPYSENIGYFEYGGMIRWGFFQAAFIPASFAIILHANSSNFGNVLFTQSRGIELLSGLNVGNLSLYIGIGQVSATGLFSKTIASPENGTSTDQRSNISSIHTFAGGAFEFEPYFFAVQVDQYTQATYSGKLGLRF